VEQETSTANVVDGLFAIARALHQVAKAIEEGYRDESGGNGMT